MVGFETIILFYQQWYTVQGMNLNTPPPFSLSSQLALTTPSRLSYTLQDPTLSQSSSLCVGGKISPAPAGGSEKRRGLKTGLLVGKYWARSTGTNLLRRQKKNTKGIKSKTTRMLTAQQNTTHIKERSTKNIKILLLWKNHSRMFISNVQCHHTVLQ